MHYISTNTNMRIYSCKYYEYYDIRKQLLSVFVWARINLVNFRVGVKAEEKYSVKTWNF